MATNITPTVYPKDLTMSLDSNHIKNEIRDFANDNERIFVPNGGPFYSQSMQIQTKDGRLLRPITEYQLLYLNEDATLESNRNVCAVVRILNKTITSVVLNYRVIGGEYSNTVYAIKQDLLKGGKNDQFLDWNTNVYNKPSEYPVGPHFHRGEDFTDWDAVWVQLEGIRKAIIHGDGASWQSVYNYIDAKVSRDVSNAIGNNNVSFQQALDTALVNYTLKTELNAFKTTVYTKSEVDNLIKTVNNKINTDVSAAKTEAINKANEAKAAADAAKKAADTALVNAATADSKAVANASEISKLKTKDTAIDAEIAKLKQADTEIRTLAGNAKGKVSVGTGNLLEMRPDGIYYGIQAPADKSNIYVDCVAGNDTTGDGTKAKPYKTLNKALLESPQSQSNTIWLKVVPTAQANTHHYEITINSFAVKSGATRTFMPYGHDLLDGPGFEAMKKLADKNVSNHYANANIPNIPVYIRQRYFIEYDLKRTRTTGVCYLNDGATLDLRKIDFIVDFLEPEKVAEGYQSRDWNSSSLFLGVGKVSFKCCGIYRLIPASIKNENYVNNPAAAIYKKDYNTDFFTTSYAGQKIEFQFAYTLLGYGYAASESISGTYKRGGKVTMDPRFDPANFKGFSWSGAPLNGSGCRPFAALGGGEIGIINSVVLPGGIGNAVRAGNWSEHKSNTGLWFSNHRMISGVIYKLGIPTNVSTNLTLDVNNKASKNYGELETIPVGGLFITTKEYTNGTQIKADLGYGRWERYAKGMTLVGVDPAVKSSRANHVLSFWQKIGNTFGSYVNVLNTGNLPVHRHSKDNIWNKFGARASDTPHLNDTTSGTDGTNTTTEYSIAWLNDQMWNTATEAMIGSGLPINNVQPSITVGIWVRLPDETGNDPVIPTVYVNNVPDFAKSEMELINDTDIRDIKLSLNRHDLHIRTNRNINVTNFAYVGKPSVNNTTDTNRIYVYLNSTMAGSQRLQNRVAVPPSEYARQGTGTLTGNITGHEYNEFGKIINYDLPSANTPNNDLTKLPTNYRNALNAAKTAKAQIVDLGNGKRGYLMGTQVISQAHTGSVPYNGDSTRQVATFRSTVANSWVSNIASTYGFTGYPTAAKDFTSMITISGATYSGSVVLHEMSAEVPYTDNPYADHIVGRAQKGSINLQSGVIPNKVALRADYFFRRTITSSATMSAPNHDTISWYLIIPVGFAT